MERMTGLKRKKEITDVNVNAPQMPQCLLDTG